VQSLTVAMRKKGGRNHHGHITVRHRGGGHRRRYRLVDFTRRVLDVPAIVQRLEYDPNRTAHIALVQYENGMLSYIIAPDGLKPGDRIMASRSEFLDVKVGNAMPLELIPIGTMVHNIEMRPGKGGQLARSAGASCQLLEKNIRPGYALVRLVSREVRMIHMKCMATIGSVSNPLIKLEKHGKAGRVRWLGRRPHVRGVAMNPVDHPHGGGEGKTSGGRPSCTPWGKPTKGAKTRDKRKNSTKLIWLTRHDARKQ
jgi:large subunit ribosomal protein L2